MMTCAWSTKRRTVVWSQFQLAVVALSIFSSTQAQAQPVPDHDKVPFLEGDPNFLFLGNSYTMENNLPNLVRLLLEAGVPEWDGHVEYKRRDPGGERFAGHLQQADGSKGSNAPVRQWLVDTKTRWKFKWVILQDQSQVPGFVILRGGPGSREYAQSVLAAQELNRLIQDNGGQTLFLQTWGRRTGDERNRMIYPDFLTMQAHLNEGYQRYWEVTNTYERPTYIAPAGLVFQTIYNDLLAAGEDPTAPGSLFYSLYQRDGSHPSLAGSYAAALTIYTTITGKNPKEVNWFPPNLDKEVCVLIQDAVNRTILQTYASHTIEYPWPLPWPNHDIVSVEL